MSSRLNGATETKYANELALVEASKKRVKLQELDFFCLDNSIRESTVGQLRSHTVENKVAIFEQVKKCGIDDIIVASFSGMPRVDDEFVALLQSRGEDFSNLYSFSELVEKNSKGEYERDKIPASLSKNDKFQIRNIIFEIDLGSERGLASRFSIGDICEMILTRTLWVKEKIRDHNRILFNFRDFPIAVKDSLDRVLTVAEFIASLQPKCFGLMYEDAVGDSLPEHMAAWTRSMRGVMDANGWKDGKLLVHVHEKWGLATATQLECLGAGAGGVWASLCEEGAAVGHACSTVTMMNLVRLGNKKVLEKYNCTQLRQAAREVTHTTTGEPAHPKQIIYGERALDIVINGIGPGDLDMAEFFGEKPLCRITVLTAPGKIREALVERFGPNTNFTDDIARKMLAKMNDDLLDERKEEYMSDVGLIHLFKEAGGTITREMCAKVEKQKEKRCHHKHLIDKVQKRWNSWDENAQHKDSPATAHLPYTAFYNGFLSRYFPCDTCPRTKAGLQALTIGESEVIEWKEFHLYVKWALDEYPDITDVDTLLKTVFEKGLVPTMRLKMLEKNVDDRQLGIHSHL